MIASRLALGTVQFGLPYGVDRQAREVDAAEVRRIVARARSLGLDTLDTAIAYGKSEALLGQIGVNHWQVISKVPSLPVPCPDIEAWLLAAARGSLQRLRCAKLYAFLLHDPRQLLGDQGSEIYHALQRLKRDGLVENVGISVYGPDELDDLCPRFRFDLVQAPINVLDRRIADSGWLARLKEARIEVHGRSIFLQGLLLMPTEHRPVYFKRWQGLWETWDAWLDANRLTPLQACLGFALAHTELNRLVVGVNSLRHLEEIATSANSLPAPPPADLASTDLDLLNPSRWRLE